MGRLYVGASNALVTKDNACRKESSECKPGSKEHRTNGADEHELGRVEGLQEVGHGCVCAWK